MPLSNQEWDIELSKESNDKQNILKSLQSSTNKDSLPNVVLIVADDLGYTDISVNGNELIKTENIDGIAKEGINFQNAYCTAPICASSRAALLTGRYQNRFGFEYQIQNRYAKNRLEILGMNWFIDNDPWSLKWTTSVPSPLAMEEQGLPEQEITIAEILRTIGYRTGIIGKWHLGKKEGKLPHNFGFDYHYGFYNSHSLFVPEGTPGYIDTKVKKDWTDQYIWESQRDGLSAIVENDKEIIEPKYLTDQIAEKTINFIESTGDKPFFAYVPFSAPHTPFQAPLDIYENLEHIKDPVVRTYQAMIKSLDLAIGQIYNHLESRGLLDDTIIIITSDNGGARYTTATQNSPFKGGKINQFEGGLRVPFIIKTPASEHVDNEYRVSTLDICKTILDVTGIQSSTFQLDGLDLFSSESQLDKRDLFWQVGHSKTIISNDFKLIFNDGEYKFSRLYNLKNDPSELYNITQSNEVIIDSLKAKHNEWSKKMAKPKWPGVVKYVVKDDNELLLFES